MKCENCQTEIERSEVCPECYTTHKHGIVAPDDGLLEFPEWIRCQCGGKVGIRVWGEGIDSEIICTMCDNEEIYR